KTMTASLMFNADLGNYSEALGAAQRLSNRNFSFTSGRQGEPPNVFGQSIEVRPDGSKAYVLEINRTLYRSYRVRTLYEGTGDLPDGGGRVSQEDSPNRNGLLPSLADISAAIFATPLAGPAESLMSRTSVSPPIPTRAANAPEALARLDRFFSASTRDEPARVFARPAHHSAFADMADSLPVDLRALALAVSDQ